MGYVVLWLENLAAVLLLTATVVACASRWKRPIYRIGLPVLALLLILAAYGGLTGVVGVLNLHFLAAVWFYPLAVLTFCCIAGACGIVVTGLRREADDSSPPRAADWPRAKLAMGFALVLALHLMTFWNLDLAVKQQMSVLRAESGALALSVAPARVPDRENAALIYTQAFQVVGDQATWPKAYDDKWCKWLDPGQPGFDAKDAELRAFLKQQAGALALLREAGRKPACYFDRDYGRPSIDMLLPEMQELRGGARLLALDARVKAADHDLHGALDDCRALLSMTDHVASDPLLIAMLVSAAIQGISAQTLEAVLNSAPATAEDLAPIDVGDTLSYQQAFRRTLRMEEAFGEATVYDVATGRFSLGNLEAFDGKAYSWTTPWFPPVYRLFFLGEDLDSFRHIGATLQRLAMKPYYQAKPDWDGFEAKFVAQPVGLLTKKLAPAVAYCAEAAARADAQHDVLRLAVAVCRFQAHHHRFPSDPSELVPDCIAAVPRDPFDGKPLRMKETEGKLVVYSIGPDAIDNSGAPFDRQKKTGDIPFTVRGWPRDDAHGTK